jgi:type IV pilus assembly protein PilC
MEGTTVTANAPELKLRKTRMALYNGKKAKPEMMARSLRALAMILRVGESEARALEITGIQFRKYDVGRAMTRAASVMREQGATFKQVMLAEDVFPRTVRELISAAPTSAGIHRNLVKAAKLVAQSQNVKKKLAVSMIQPGFMLGMAIVFLFIASAVILPGFIKTFSALSAKTPEMTLVVLAAANVTKYVVGALIAVILLWVAFWNVYGKRSTPVRIAMDTLGIKSPILGSILQLASTSRMFELLSTNLQTGMGESAALESAGSGAGNEAIRALAFNHAEKMRVEGVRMADFTNSPLLPENAKYMMASAPSVKQQIDIMEELGPEYREEADRQLEAFSKTLEPIVQYIVYAVVGLLIIAVMVPMYAMFPALMALDPTTTPTTGTTGTVQVPTTGSTSAPTAPATNTPTTPVTKP